MGKSVNKVQIIGTLGRDPEMKYLPSGSAVVSVSVATDESYQDKNSGQKVEKTEWHRMTAFGKLAEIIGQYLKKGSKAYFEGKLRTNEYEKDGIKRYSTEIVICEMMMLDGKQEGQPQQNGQLANNWQQPAPQQGGFQPQQPMNPNQPPVPPQGQPMGVSQGGQPMPQNNFGNNDQNIPF
jgi:single-strand DNA-binding protein